MSKGIQVTAVDLETGQSASKVIQSGNYVIIAADPCYIAGEQHHANGTTVLTLKGRSADLLSLELIPPSTEDGAR